jgi:hypothetical protein
MFFQFLGFFGVALLGLLIFFGIGLQKFDQETPGLAFKETLYKYFRDKRFASITNLLIIAALVLIMVIDPTGWYVSWLSGGTLTGDLPAKSYVLALFIGLFNQALLSVLMGKRNPIAGFDKKEEDK